MSSSTCPMCMLAGLGRKVQTKEHLFSGECILTKETLMSREEKTVAMLKEEGIEKRHITEILNTVKASLEKIRAGERSIVNHRIAPTMIGMWDNSTMLQIRKILMEEVRLSEKQAWEKIDKMTVIYRDIAREANKLIAKTSAGLTEDIQEKEVEEAMQTWAHRKERGKVEQVKKAWELETILVKDTEAASRTAYGNCKEQEREKKEESSQKRK